MVTFPLLSAQGCSKTKTSSCSSQTRTCWMCECGFSLLLALMWRTISEYSTDAQVEGHLNSHLNFSVGFTDWLARTRLSSMPSSWCCTLWQAACPLSPVPALLAMSLPVLTVICQVSEKGGAGQTGRIYGKQERIAKSYKEMLLTSSRYWNDWIEAEMQQTTTLYYYSIVSVLLK